MMDAITLLAVSGLAAALLGGGLCQLAYQRGRTAGVESAAGHYEPLLAQRQHQLDALAGKILRQRTEHEDRWTRAIATIERLQQPAPIANPKICDCPENGGCTEPCVRIEQPA